MKSNIKPFSSFINEIDDTKQELLDIGFDLRQDLGNPYELEKVIHELFFKDPEI